jgi:rubrerythrin
MGKGNEETLKALKTAIEAELTGHEFYKNAAQSTDDPNGKAAFRRMAAEEMKHFEYLRHQYRAVLKQGGYDFSKSLVREPHEHGTSPIFSEDIRARIKDSHFEVSALTIGMKLEFDAVKFYESCAQMAEDEKARQLYLELADWERGHYEAFQQELEALKEDYFEANQFFPM